MERDNDDWFYLENMDGTTPRGLSIIEAASEFTDQHGQATSIEVSLSGSFRLASSR